MKRVIALACVLAASQTSYANETVEGLIEQLNKPATSTLGGERKTRSFGASPGGSKPIDTPSADCQFDNGIAPNATRGKTRSLYVTEAPKVDLQIQFAYDSSALLEPAQATLQTLAQALNSTSLANQSFIVAGHTDRAGTAEYNRQLSCARANSVARFLVQQGGVDAERLTLYGFGYDRLKDPANPNAEINRRVEIQRVSVQ